MSIARELIARFAPDEKVGLDSGHGMCLEDELRVMRSYHDHTRMDGERESEHKRTLERPREIDCLAMWHAKYPKLQK